MRYYVNKNQQLNGDHEVHQEIGCPTPAEEYNREDLGDFSSCSGAVKEANDRGYNANGCFNCSRVCHTG